VTPSEPTPLDVLAHELRSPVAALAALADAARASPDGATRLELARLGVAAGRDVARLLRDPEPFSVRLADVRVRELLERLHGVETTCPAALVVRADAGRLLQALDNLVENARRHAERVTVIATMAGGRARIAVADDGPGLPPGLDVLAPGVSGAGSTGLGLYVASGVAAAHGGSLEVATAPGAGTTFTLVLPCASSARG
jgi:signal transduction histidine kinase